MTVMTAIGNRSTDLLFGIVGILAGTLFLIWAFSSKPVKKQQGLRNKLDLLFSDGLEGPQQNGRVFAVGTLAIVLGCVGLTAYIKPGLALYAFWVAWLSGAAMFLYGAHRKWSPPTGERRKVKNKHGSARGQ